MRERVVVLGGGHGTSAVVRALRDAAVDLSIVVTIADDGGSSGALRGPLRGLAVGDMRRSLTALSGEGSVAGRALSRPVTIHRVGTHPLGNLLLQSLTGAFGDLGLAASWLEDQIGVAARVLPATREPVALLAETQDGRLVHGESAIGRCRTPLRRLYFSPACPRSPRAALRAVAAADLLLLAPGSLFTSTLATAALPDLRATLAASWAPVVWLCNLGDGGGEANGLSASRQLAALTEHGIRVDAVLYDPEAGVCVDRRPLQRAGVRCLAHPLQGDAPGVHGATLLRAALEQLLSSLRRPSV